MTEGDKGDKMRYVESPGHLVQPGHRVTVSLFPVSLIIRRNLPVVWSAVRAGTIRTFNSRSSGKPTSLSNFIAASWSDSSL